MASVHDTISRTCENSAGNVLAVQTLSVVAHTIETVDASGTALITADSQSQARRFQRTGKIQNVRTQTVASEVVDRVIDTVTTTGSFDSFTKNGTEVDVVTYAGKTSDVNDVIIGVAGHPGVYNIGDTV